MKYQRLLQLLVAILLIIAMIPLYEAPPAAKAQEIAPTITRDTPYMPGEVIVSFARGSNAEQNAAVMDLVGKQFGVQPVRGEAQTLLLRGDAQLDVEAAAKSMEQLPGVEYAEPNYIFWIPEPAAAPDGAQRDTQYVTRKAPENFSKAQQPESAYIKIPVSQMSAMKTKRSGKVQAVYPNDDYLWSNWGWSWVEADVVSSNSTASANVCEIDTGVDYTHKDLSGKVIKGYDFISDDTDPMDDNGHGTHVAGIIAAVKGNSEGIAGVSTGKVVAVKAMTAQGWGTDFDIGSAIIYCANRTDVKVINMSLGSTYDSSYIRDKINTAVNVANKLVVAAAGNNLTSSPFYPAYYATLFPNKVLAVAAAGQWYHDTVTQESYLYEDCWANTYSNYGSWISVVAPGTTIFSLLPWDKPFYMSSGPTRYGTLSGTSMAAPFVAGAAARRWGYTPTALNSDVGYAVTNSGWEIDADGTCWPTSMAGKYYANVAALLDRGAAFAEAYDASNGNPLAGATVYVNRGTSTLGSGVISPLTEKALPGESDPNRVYTYFNSVTDIINLPTNTYSGGPYISKISKSGFTASPQLAFNDMNHGNLWIDPGLWTYLGSAYVPPKSANFDIVMDSESWYDDFDLDVYLPGLPNAYDPSQPYDYMVGPEGYSGASGDPTEPYGTLTTMPYARFRYGEVDFPPMENIVIKKRSAHGASGQYVPANANLPYWAGYYDVVVTDYGQTTDGNSLLYAIPSEFEPLSVFVWKDGVIKRLILYNYVCGPGDHWWWALDIFSASGSASSPTYYDENTCYTSQAALQAADASGGRMRIAR